jgi:hypothetical protein
VALVLLGGALIVFGAWPRLVLDAIDVGTSTHLPGVLGAAAMPDMAL